MDKTPFFEMFHVDAPSMELQDLLGTAIYEKRFIKKNMAGEIEHVKVVVKFPHHVPFHLILKGEQELLNYYRKEKFPALMRFQIVPHFPKESFKLSLMDELAEEATRWGGAAIGFFQDATYREEGGTIVVEIPYMLSGVDFVNRHHTEQYLSDVLETWYDLKKTFRICSSESAEVETQRRLQAYEEIIASYEGGTTRASHTEENGPKVDEKGNPIYPRGNVETLYPIPYNHEQVEPGVFSFGHIQFDVREPKWLLGDAFSLDHPTPLGEVKDTKQTIVLLGKIFSCEQKDVQNKEKLQVKIGITDGVHSIFMKKTDVPTEFDWVAGIQKAADKGLHMYCAFQCKLQRDRYDNELTGMPLACCEIKRVERQDNSLEKRTELHLHTTMSQMDAFISPADLIATATRWGWKAVAVTDHGNVQGFPEVMLAKVAQNSPVKVLWGIEAYYVNDKARAVYGSLRPSFQDEMVVFDIETTGLNAQTNEIIEIGAVLIRDGEVVDTMDTFVHLDNPIPESITELTSITNEMVADAPSLETALEMFLNFAGDRLLIAHNANFDCGFIREAATKLKKPFNNTYLDTVALSRYLNPELSKHKLDVLAKHYGLGDFNHHRASDDATMLALIFEKMLGQLKTEGIHDFNRMVDVMAEKSDPLKLRSYHMIIFAKNLRGLRTLYELISESYLHFYHRVPRIPRSLLENRREDLIIGSACESGELFQAMLDHMSQADIEEIASFYDYLEIQPLCNNRFLIAQGRARDDEELRDLNRQIVELGEKLHKPVVATCDAHFLNREDELLRKIILKGMKFSDAEKDTGIYLRTTEEMLQEFSYLGEEKAREIVITNPNAIADLVEEFKPIPDGRYEPKLEGAEEELYNSCWSRARELYGFYPQEGMGPPFIPALVTKRLAKELNAIQTNGFSVLYMIAVKLVAYSESQGYLVGSRGSVGSSFVASMSGISEVNPLAPHYRCPKCHFTEFFTDGSVGSGFDLPDKSCPICGTPYVGDGHDIPFETFLGFKGNKSPDIDLNFSGDVQGLVHKYTETLFGEGHVFRAGTVSVVADKTAVGYVLKYLDEHQMSLSRAEVEQLAYSVAGVKKTTGQHPGGIIVVPKELDIHEFTPVQHPADDPKSDIITTHFQFTYLHETILKLDELGHDMPTKYKMLEKYTGTSVLDVKMNDPAVYQLFASCEPLGIKPEDIGGCQLGTYGLPEMGTHFVQGVLIDAQPKTFADLLQIMGLTHGTDVWLGNAQDLIKAGICDITKVIGTRDGIMIDLIRYGLPDNDAFTIMESVRKGKGLKPEWEEEMKAHDVPDWYIDSCKKIKYMFPKAHAAAYGMSAIRLGWYKIHYPLEFYAAFLSVAPGGFDAEMVMRGKNYIRFVIDELSGKSAGDLSQKDKETVATMHLVEESMARGIEYLPPDLYKSHYQYFTPEDGKIRMPFSAVAGLGETAAKNIFDRREEGAFHSIEDFRKRTGVSKTIVELLRNMNVFAGLNETDQLSIFDL